MQHAYASGVKITSPRHLRRRERLNELVDTVGQTRLANEIGTPKSHLSALQAGKRGIGDDLAAKLDRFGVEELGKPPGWLDATEEAPQQPAAVPFRDLGPFEAQLITLFRALSPDEQHDHLVELNKRVDKSNGDKVSHLNPYAGIERRKQAVPVAVERRGQFGSDDRRPAGKRAGGGKK
jgi:hypothetical protein